MKRFTLLIAALMLSSCGGGGTTSDSNETDQKSLQNLSKSEEIESVIEHSIIEGSTLPTISSNEVSTGEETLSVELESSEASSLSDDELQYPWELTASDIGPATNQSQYLYDFDFTVSHEGGLLSFHGDVIQPGAGDWEGLIQMKKGEGTISSKFSCYGTIEVSIKERIVTYGGEDHDYTGVPIFSCGEENSLVAIDADKVENKNGFRVFTYSVDGYISLLAGTGNALYLERMSFAPIG